MVQVFCIYRNADRGKRRLTQAFLVQSQQLELRNYHFLQSLKAQEGALSDSEDRDDMDMADGGGKC